MKRFAIAAALAVVLGLGFSGKADAQYFYRNTAITPGGGLITTNQVYTPFGVQARNIYVAPNGAVKRQYITGNPFGNTYFSNGFNPNTGAFFNRGFYQPNPFIYPYPYYGGYNFYRRW